MPGSTPAPSTTSTAEKPMSLVSSSAATAAGAIERDVEFARQAEQRARVEHVEVPAARVGARVDQLLRIDAGGGCAGDVADIVGARAAGDEAEVLDRLDQRWRALGGYFADLQIGAGGDVRVAAAMRLREQRQTRHLPVVEDAVGHAQAAHEAVLVRRDVEQAVPAPAVIVLRLGVIAGRGFGLQPAIGVERVLVALELFLVGELACPSASVRAIAMSCGASGPVGTVSAGPAATTDRAALMPATRPSR